VRFLVLAEKDMELVEDAVGLLTAPHMIAGGRLIEAGMFTIYARPYAPDRKRRVLGDEWLPSDPRERKRHDRLIELRNTLYAHTDPDSPRGVEDVDAMLGLGEHGYAESRPELNQAALPRIARPCPSSATAVQGSTGAPPARTPRRSATHVHRTSPR
jgi:hypothetical protein